MTTRVLLSTAVVAAATTALALAFWGYSDLGAVWMLQALRLCG